MSTVAIQRPLVIACSRDSRMLAFSTTHRSTEGGFCFVAVYQRVRAGKLALGELELGIAHFQLGPDADLLPGAGEAEVLSCGLHALCGDARLLSGRGELGDGALHVAGYVAAARTEIDLGLRRGDVRLGGLGLGGKAAEHVPGQVDAAPQGAGRVDRVGERTEVARLLAEASIERDGWPVIAPHRRSILALRLHRQREGLQARA